MKENEYLNELYKDEREVWDKFEKYIVLITSGLFVMSFVYVPKLVEIKTSVFRCCYFISCSFLSLNVIISLVSQVVSYQAIRFNIENIYQNGKKTEKSIKRFNIWIDILNYTQIVLLFVSVVLLNIYVLNNL